MIASEELKSRFRQEERCFVNIQVRSDLNLKEEKVEVINIDLRDRVIGYLKVPDSYIDRDMTTHALYLPLDDGMYYKMFVRSREMAKQIADIFILDSTFLKIRKFLVANNFNEWEDV